MLVYHSGVTSAYIGSGHQGLRTDGRDIDKHQTMYAFPAVGELVEVRMLDTGMARHKSSPRSLLNYQRVRWPSRGAPVSLQLLVEM